jgi:uroporphyrinogen decarboxylase
MVEGGSSEREKAREIAYRREPWFVDLLDRLVLASVEYLGEQIKAGADAVQIFDSWAGELPESLKQDVVVRPLERLVSLLRERHPGTPVIVFAKGLGVGQKELAQRLKPAAVGIETELSMAWAARELADVCAVQGNLDPVALLAGRGVAVEETRRIVGSIPRNKHIFNLGHGIRQTTPVETVSAVIETVRKFDAAG